MGPATVIPPPSSPLFCPGSLWGRRRQRCWKKTLLEGTEAARSCPVPAEPPHIAGSAALLTRNSIKIQLPENAQAGARSLGPGAGTVRLRGNVLQQLTAKGSAVKSQHSNTLEKGKNIPFANSTLSVKENGKLHLRRGYCALPALFLPILALYFISKRYLLTDHRIVGVGRDLCGSSSPTLLPKQGHLQ